MEINESYKKEIQKLMRQEQVLLKKKSKKRESKLNQILAEKVPEKLQDTLDGAFQKAFGIIFDKGTNLIELTYNRKEIEKNYKVNEYAVKMYDTPKTMSSFSKRAGNASSRNLLISSVSGVGLGVLGIGLPDIVVFTGLILKSVYEIALNYGYDYESEQERMFILLLIEGAMSYETKFREVNEKVKKFIQQKKFEGGVDFESHMKRTAQCLSEEMLYMKFLQGIPIVGAAGGAWDVIYLKQIVSYAQLRYRHRFYFDRCRS